MPDDVARLKREYVRFRVGRSGTTLQVVLISWPQVYRPVARWRVVRRWTHSLTSAEQQAAINAVLRDERFFRRCKHCGELMALGHMDSSGMCQGCAERLLKIVY
jgi:hypothetical protein